MARCNYCDKEMLDSVPCHPRTYRVDGRKLATIPYGEGEWEYYGQATCHDCSTPVHGIHHFGCDMEECPNCHGQLITCNCNMTSMNVNGRYVRLK